MTTLAVLLIIGSAVVGPIEAQKTNTVDCHNGAVKVCENLFESLPELCERAMTEIGATKDVRGHWWLFETIGTAKPRPNDYNTGYTEVRCIPVPTGYKR